MRSYIPDSLPFEDSHDDYAYKIKANENFKLLKAQSRISKERCNFSDEGFASSFFLLLLGCSKFFLLIGK